jgi:hypothetical protein
MVPEHLPSMPYTHVTSGRVRDLGGVTFVSQWKHSACGDRCVMLLAVMCCLLYWSCFFPFPGLFL